MSVPVAHPRYFLLCGLLWAAQLAVAAPATDIYASAARRAPQSLLLDAVRVGTRLVAVGERGHILLSDDQGENWRQARVPTRATLTAVYFPDARHGWAVGHDSTILASADGGETWSVQFTAPEDDQPLLDVWFADLKNGVAIGAYGQYFTTSNAGASWAAKAISEDDYHLNAIAVTARGEMYIAAEAGRVFRSTDGQRWETIDTPYAGSYFGILAIPDGGLVLFGLRGKLFYSADAGASWTAANSGGEDSLLGGQAGPDGTVVIVGLGGAILRSRDGGRNFQRFTRPARRGYSAVLTTPDDALLLFGEDGVTRANPGELR